ncbi:patatin-like protein [Rhodobacteraceae bacterium RKSG542]|uniref:patatin-like protein n=1 Tax=Pseudovibrio flavus TaxID=2529854 RepID=UPI0012BD481D|nr:patatin-like protein [Pseudovibrio flavus]MTI16426.1 patatin-like protein [Pseudovibrio flavus]
MRQLELRLALVLYGGVSLAVYMHGVTREMLNLQRAAKFAEKGWSPSGKSQIDADGQEEAIDQRPLTKSAEAYHRIFSSFMPDMELRVVIDAISGASAGGINGIMLARALAHDLPLDGHRDLWLERADISWLSQKPKGMSQYVKSLSVPVIRKVFGLTVENVPEDREVRAKLNLFMRQRWFAPPFSGSRFTGWMLDACRQMEKFNRGGTLIPQGQSLDLFATLTDFHGTRRRIKLYDPPFIEEIDHRKILGFRATNSEPLDLESQMDFKSIPDIVFAARASSSFPGAFAPMTIAEMDRVLEHKGLAWPHRRSFIRDVLDEDEESGRSQLYIDGSVVMNKPFRPVIEAIVDRPAVRQVVRRVVYVDPRPSAIGGDVPFGEMQEPGFFRSIVASLAHIPRNEPIGDELEEIEIINQRSRRAQAVIVAAGPQVKAELSKILGPKFALPKTAEQMTLTRRKANQQAQINAGFSYAGYPQLKRERLVHKVAKLLKHLAAQAGVEQTTEALQGAISRYLEEESVHDPLYGNGLNDRLLTFFRGLDVDYRVRRLRFVIGTLNNLYGTKQFINNEIGIKELNSLKGVVYEQISNLRLRWEEKFYGEPSPVLAELVQTMPDSEDAVRDGLALAAKLMGLQDLDQLHDEMIFQTCHIMGKGGGFCGISEAYLGFAFYDVITLPVQQSFEFPEIGEIEVERISPVDARALGTEAGQLKGIRLQSFGAFFNRRWREHDYLWGRLHAAERLINLLMETCQLAAIAEGDALEERRNSALKEAFLAILEEEEPHLKADPDLIDRCRQLLKEKLG